MYLIKLDYEIKMEIINSDLRPEFLEELRDLFLAEWANVDSFDGNRVRANPPRPLLALENNNLLGGLSFTWYYLEGSSEIKLWVNAVYVKPEFRGLGIAMSLINQAVKSAAETNENELYVYTELPQLYTSIGWQQVSSQDQNYVLQIKLSQHEEKI